MYEGLVNFEKLAYYHEHLKQWIAGQHSTFYTTYVKPLEDRVSELEETVADLEERVEALEEEE